MTPDLHKTRRIDPNGGRIGAVETPARWLDLPGRGRLTGVDMAQPIQGGTPFSPPGLSENRGWHGIPGAKLIPRVGDPALTPFLLISRRWIAAGIEMTEEMVEAAVKLARAHVEVGREESRLTEAKRREEAERLAATKPESYGSAEQPVVYYVLRGKYVKIGTTVNLRERMRDLMPDAVLAVEPGGRALERRMHEHFARIRYSRDREYFLLTEELQEHIDAVLAKHGPPPPDLSILDQSA